MKSEYKKRKYVYMAVIGLLLFLFFIKVFSPFENLVINILKPVTGKVYDYGFFVKSFFDDRKDSEELETLVAEMKSELNKNLVDQTRIEKLEEENRLLRDSLGFLSRNNLSYVMANIVSRGGAGESLGRLETIVIDKGTKDGMREGLVAVNSDGLVVGKVSGVKESISQVLLSNNDNCKLATTIMGQEKTSGITHGELGLTIKMEFIPQSMEIKEGDIVISSGLEELIPRGLVVGKVSQVVKENNELWQTATIEPQYDHENLAMIAVVIPE